MRAKYGRGSRRFTRCSPIDTVRLEILSSSTARLMVSNSISVSCDSSMPTKSYWRSSATVFFSSCACRWRSTSSASICSFIRASFPYCSVRCACSSLKILSSFIPYLLKNYASERANAFFMCMLASYSTLSSTSSVSLRSMSAMASLASSSVVSFASMKR